MKTLLIAAVLVVTLRGTAAACDPGEVVSRFELFDRASEVVVAKVKQSPKGARPGTVVLELETALKGKPAAKIEFKQTGSSCDASFPTGARMLVFMKDGNYLGDYEGPIAITKNQAWVELVTRWSKAGDDTTRAGVAADAIASGGKLASAGIFVFMNQAAIADAVTKDQIAIIKQARSKLHSGQRSLLRDALGKKLN